MQKATKNLPLSPKSPNCFQYDSMNAKIDNIVTAVNRKDKKMWRDFYDSFYAVLCVYVSKFLPLPDAVEDLVQDVFISLWESKRTFADIRELTNYLYRACYNNALLYIRNNQIHDTILSSLAQEENCVEDEEMAYALTVKEEIIRQLYCHIEALPTEQRRIILMRIEGHTWEEIAERLNISINTVKTQKARSYKFLREKLGDSMQSILLALFLSEMM